MSISIPQFKAAMARVSTQAMILTAGCKTKNDILHGMTLSSVCSLSVHPKPLLQFNLHLPSYTSQALHENHGQLCLHLMPPTSRSVFLSRTFAAGIKTDRKHFDVKPEDGEIFHEMTTPFAHIGKSNYSLHDTGRGLVPVLNEAEKAFVCKKHEVFKVDSHEIWVVDVTDILSPNKHYEAKQSGGLLYYQRGFHKVGSSLQER
ncbi:uncharacterized protein CXQ87_004627 [Candidozyma duobushaemuli]|uniref:Flavin reductase like domain-containing protein n=2 Tax=Candidozyma TaxID=3303203 RepID=A0ABX8I973_9ASCO|nr:uncharacterized protein CXQ87_004627 [[Candida] duobushaemulonis]PVH17067.1 hypothetical protein CXQ87_004627 [[Candida] duobushaemulonis]QWU89824.1 hypothetical protein CA3LBN_004172 [[Candida] haemuloni]